jgi:hypothetical protein
MTSKQLKKNFHVSSIVKQPPSKRAKFVSSLSDLQAEILIHDWSKHARPEQLAPAGVSSLEHMPCHGFPVVILSVSNGEPSCSPMSP